MCCVFLKLFWSVREHAALCSLWLLVLKLGAILWSSCQTKLLKETNFPSLGWISFLITSPWRRFHIVCDVCVSSWQNVPCGHPLSSELPQEQFWVLFLDVSTDYLLVWRVISSNAVGSWQLVVVFGVFKCRSLAETHRLLDAGLVCLVPHVDEILPATYQHWTSNGGLCKEKHTTGQHNRLKMWVYLQRRFWNV